MDGMSEQEKWMAEHKGQYLYSWGQVWDCEDDVCGCTEAQVVDFYRNKVVHNARVPVVAWRGEFRTDHEPGAAADLVAYRRALRGSDPEREAAISWQEGIDYEGDE